jgi:hypothetical protein
MNESENFFVYVVKGLFFRFFLISVLFSVDAALWCTLEFYGLLESAESFVHALDVYNFVLTAVYYLWFTTFLKGYSEPATAYRTILLNAGNFVQKFYGFAITSSDITIMKRDKGSDKIKKELEEFSFFHIHSAKIIREIPYIVIAIIHYSLQLFHEIKIPFPDMGAIDDEIVQELHLKNTAKAKIDFLLYHINTRIKTLEEFDYLSGADTNTLNHDIDKIYESLTVIDLANNVKEPRIYKDYIRIVIFAYFLLWVPFLLAIYIGWIAILLYPIIMNLTIGPAVISGWLGDVFDPFRPLHINRHECWRKEFTDQVFMYHSKYENNSKPLHIHNHGKKTHSSNAILYPKQDKNEFYGPVIGKNPEQFLPYISMASTEFTI